MPQLEADIPSAQTRTLDQMPSGSGGVIIALSGGRSLVSRLATLGFVPGGDVRMVQNYGRGPVIVLVRQSRCALGRGEAAQVIVRGGRSSVSSCHTALAQQTVFTLTTGVTVALAGQPNVGKSTVFNTLTGLNQHVGNWAGKTVEQRTAPVPARRR